MYGKKIKQLKGKIIYIKKLIGIEKWLPVTKRSSKARDIALDAVCCSGTIKCRSRGINKQSHFEARFVPSRHFLHTSFLYITF
jgi:hypothetical protein